MNEEKFLTPIELAQRWRGVISVGTINNWRISKTRKGPAYIKVSGAVLYAVADIEEYERLHRINVGEVKK